MESPIITIVDYGAGNIRSVLGALAVLNRKAHVTCVPKEVRSARLLILPGVGSFGSAMRNLRERGLTDAVREAVDDGAAILGICLGMQLLGQSSEEDGGCEGLQIVPGRSERFRSVTGAPLRIPHMGFNSVHWSAGSPQYEGLPDQADFYFVHSFRFADVDVFAEHDIGITHHGGPFVSSFVIDRRIFGMQYHPELSQGNGLLVLRNFFEAQSA